MHNKSSFNILGNNSSLEHQTRYGKIINFINSITDTPGLKKPITIFPDAHLKNWGFPSGVGLQTSLNNGIIFPAAVSDIGCGFRVIKTNLYKKDIKFNQIKRLVDSIYELSGPESSYRLAAVKKLDFEKIFYEGVEYLIESGIGEKNDLLKIQKHFTENLIEPKINFMDDNVVTNYFGIFSNHFFEVRYIGEILDKKTASLYDLNLEQLIVIMHTGSIPNKDTFLKNYYFPAVEYSFEKKIFSQKLIENGIFGVPIDSSIGNEYLKAAGALVNYSYSSRHFSAQLVLEAFKQNFGSNIEFELISDVCHSKFEVRDNYLLQLRGIQSVFPKDHIYTMPYYKDTGDLVHIAGQKYISSYLALPTNLIKSTNYLCSHGIGEFEDLNLVSDIPSWVKEESRQGYFNIECDIEMKLRSEYNNVNYSLNVLANESKIISLVARLAPFINITE